MISQKFAATAAFSAALAVSIGASQSAPVQVPPGATIKAKPLAPKVMTLKQPVTETEGTPNAIKVGTATAGLCVPSNEDCQTKLSFTVCPPMAAVTVSGVTYVCATSNCVKLNDSTCDCDIDMSDCATL